MADQTPTPGRTHRVRPARASDLRHLAGIEDSGAAQYAAWFGPEINPVLVAAGSSGQWRASQPGFILVAPGDHDETDAPVGFAHVLDLDAHAHLEQLSVRPEHQRRGLGRALVEAAMTEARRLGYPAMSLCTYRDVPWNGPFYAGLGFVEVTDLTPYQRRLREHEQQLGLDQDGVRVVMQVALR